MKNMSKIGNGLIMTVEIGNGGGGVKIHGGKINLVCFVINFGINMRRKLIYLRVRESIY
jgi:hypothetical protein